MNSSSSLRARSNINVKLPVMLPVSKAHEYIQFINVQRLKHVMIYLELSALNRKASPVQRYGENA